MGQVSGIVTEGGVRNEERSVLQPYCFVSNSQTFLFLFWELSFDILIGSSKKVQGQILCKVCYC